MAAEGEEIRQHPGLTGDEKEGDPEMFEDPDVKIILLGDSAVGKSKLVERYLMDDYNPRQLSTYALTMFRKDVTLPEGNTIQVDFWDTAGQERFNSMHPSYYYRAHACVLVFDVTRKLTYQHLSDWYSELRQYCEEIPCILVANKIDVDYKVTRKSFKFASTHNLPFFFVSAADGTNVVKVFEETVKEAWRYKNSDGDFVSEVLNLIDSEPSGPAAAPSSAAAPDSSSSSLPTDRDDGKDGDSGGGGAAHGGDSKHGGDGGGGGSMGATGDEGKM